MNETKTCPHCDQIILDPYRGSIPKPVRTNPFHTMIAQMLGWTYTMRFRLKTIIAFVIGSVVMFGWIVVAAVVPYCTSLLLIAPWLGPLSGGIKYLAYWITGMLIDVLLFTTSWFFYEGAKSIGLWLLKRWKNK